MFRSIKNQKKKAARRLNQRKWEYFENIPPIDLDELNDDNSNTDYDLPVYYKNQETLTTDVVNVNTEIPNQVNATIETSELHNAVISFTWLTFLRKNDLN